MFRAIVIVVDVRSPDVDMPMHLRRDLESSSATTVAEILRAINVLGIKTYVYSSPYEFSLNAEEHQTDLIWPLYGGEGSRNRTAIVAAICEAHGLKYVGPDVYGHIICHDKEVAKNLAGSLGLVTPWHRVIRSHNDLQLIRHLPLPFVVKPLLEGSSIGISQRNLIRDHEAAIQLTAELLNTFAGPVIIEDFVAGKEVSYNYIAAGNAHHWSYSEIYVKDNAHYFDSHLFDAEEKIKMMLPRSVRTIDELLTEDDRVKLDCYISAVGQIVYCRIDGKHNNGKFVFIEATPDAHLWRGAAFPASFINKGWSYVDVISAIISAAVRSHLYRSTSDSRIGGNNRI